MQYMQNDSGAAFMFAMIVVLIIVAAIVWAFLMPGLNPLAKNYNEQATTRGVGVQTSGAAGWNMGFLLAIPGFGLGGLVIAAIVRANEVSQSGN
jgi:hypothetical protein